MNRFNIYRLNDDGTGSWATTIYDAETAEQALTLAHGESLSRDLVPEGGTFIVVDPEKNPNQNGSGGQLVFTLERPPAPTAVAVPAALHHGLF